MTAETVAPPLRVRANALLDGPILPTLVRASLPNLAAMLAPALVAVAETSYVGALGVPALAGLSLVFPLVMLQQMMSAGAMGGGISSAVARALGAGDRPRAESLALHATVIGLVGGLLSTALMLSFGPVVYRLLGGRGAALEEALVYSNIVFITATAIWLTNTFASVLRGSGNMKLPSFTLVPAAVLQIAVGGSLGLGWFGLPRLGMTGVALGQAVANFLTAIVLFAYLVSGYGRIRLRPTVGAISGALFWDILRVGALACISPLQSVATVLVVTRLVAAFGPKALAGYGIGARLEFLLIPVAFAIGVTCVSMVGMAIGAHNPNRARRAAWSGGLLAAAIVGGIGLLAAIWPDAWGALFTRDAGVLAATRSYFRLAGPFYGLYGLGLCLYFASQGAGKVLGPVLAGTVRLLVVVVGGLALVSMGAPAWTFFALIGAAMAAYGLVTAYAIWRTPWGAR